MRKRINFYDTSMRDGAQGIGFSMENNQKIDLLKRLLKINVSNLELGMILNKEDEELFLKASAICFQHETRIASLCRLNNIEILKNFHSSTLNLTFKEER